MRTRVPPPHLRLCWGASTKSASPCAGKPGLSTPRGGHYSSQRLCFLRKQRTLSYLLLRISPPHFFLRLLSSLCHCAALEQGPYLTMVSPPSCDHDFQVLGWISFSLLSPPDDGSSSSVSQPSNCLILSLQFPQTTGGTLKCKDTGKKAVMLVTITRTWAPLRSSGYKRSTPALNCSCLHSPLQWVPESLRTFKWPSVHTCHHLKFFSRFWKWKILSRQLKKTSEPVLDRTRLNSNEIKWHARGLLPRNHEQFKN